MSITDLNSITDRLAAASVDNETILSFAGKGIKLNSERDASEIVDEIRKCKSMKVLRLEGNTLGVEAAVAIGKAIEKHPEFERALWSDMFTGRLKTEIPPALKSLGLGVMTASAKLVELDLSDNAFGPNGMNGLIDLLTHSSCFSLRELRLNNNGLGITGGKMLAQCLLECHTSSVKAGTPLALKVFVSGRGRLENEGATALAEAFKAMGSLEEVAMPQNGINHPGISALATAFKSCKNLRSINLNDNTFTERGAESMANALKHMKKLEVINFGDCLLRSGGAEFIGTALIEGHQTLKELNLSFNEISKDGALVVAESMAGKPNLVMVDLDGNMLGDEGVDLVRGAMEAIDKLDILGSFSEDEGTEDGEGDDDDDAYEDVEDDGDGEEVPGLTVEGTAITPRSAAKTVTAVEFLQFPSPTKLQSITGEKGKEIVHSLGPKADDVDTVISTLMKVSVVVIPGDDGTRKAACECADGLLARLFDDGAENIGVTIANEILVHLGLIKSEDKKFTPVTNMNGPLIILEHAVRQPYFQKKSRDILQAFIGKANPRLEACQSRHQLLQTLYKF